MATLRPAPDIDELSRPFFEAARGGSLLVQRCTACAQAQLGNEICNRCFGDTLQWVTASGAGVVHSFVTLHVAHHPAFHPPYLAAIVELDEGPRLPVHVPHVHALQVGQRVRIDFAPAEGGLPTPILKEDHARPVDPP